MGRFGRYGRRFRRGARSFLGGKLGAGVKLALAALLVGMAVKSVPQLQNPMIQGVVGYMAPPVAGIPVSQVLIANAVTSLLQGVIPQ